MEPGKIVEYIDSQQILSAVVLEVEDHRLRLLTETDREVKLASTRLVHTGKECIDLSVGRPKLVDMLRTVASKRDALIEQIDIKELWEILNAEQEWIDLDTMTGLCFIDNPTCDHESAVIRAFFKNRLYFKFDHNRFYPHSEAEVENLIAQKKEALRRIQLIESGAQWLKNQINKNPTGSLDGNERFAEMVKSVFLEENDHPNYPLGKSILSKAGVNDEAQIFRILVDLGVFDEDENIDLLRYHIPTTFPNAVITRADELVSSATLGRESSIRKDMTCLSVMTIDGQGTQDFDDAIHIEEKGDHYFLGIHIVDVGYFIKRDNPIDQEALDRGCSIYMPDSKIPMLPTQLAEGLCSLRAGELRPAISILAKLTHSAEVVAFALVPSIIKVKHQLTYYDVNMMSEENRDIMMLKDITKQLRRNRLSQGAVQISLPDINVMIGENGDITVHTINRESPARVLVEELMILANSLMARFLVEKGIPAVFRSQHDPRERLYRGNNCTLYQNYAQRRLLNRIILGNKPERHSGIGADAYITATSPIRKYFDLINQRQIRSAFNMETPYNADELDHLIHMLEIPITNVLKLQYRRKRYWLLKYLEGQVGNKYQAIVIAKRRNHYQVLIPDYMLECNLPLSGGFELKPQDMVTITLQHVNARQETVSVFLS